MIAAGSSVALERAREKLTYAESVYGELQRTFEWQDQKAGRILTTAVVVLGSISFSLPSREMLISGRSVIGEAVLALLIPMFGLATALVSTSLATMAVRSTSVRASNRQQVDDFFDDAGKGHAQLILGWANELLAMSHELGIVVKRKGQFLALASQFLNIVIGLLVILVGLSLVGVIIRT